MNTSQSPLIAVFGATGMQGGSVMRALKAHGGYRLRAITRDASKNVAIADEVVAADLTKPETLAAALDAADGVFLVTNFWSGANVDELAQGRAAVEAASRAGVKHFVLDLHVEVLLKIAGVGDSVVGRGNIVQAAHVRVKEVLHTDAGQGILAQVGGKLVEQADGRPHALDATVASYDAVELIAGPGGDVAG